MTRSKVFDGIVADRVNAGRVGGAQKYRLDLRRRLRPKEVIQAVAVGDSAERPPNDRVRGTVQTRAHDGTIVALVGSDAMASDGAGLSRDTATPAPPRLSRYP